MSNTTTLSVVELMLVTALQNKRCL